MNRTIIKQEFVQNINDFDRQLRLPSTQERRHTIKVHGT